MKAALLSIFILLTFSSNVQRDKYLTDLNALKTIIEKTPSFKAQIRGAKLSSFNQLYNSLARDTVNKPTSFKYFYNLSQLLFPLRDNHLGFYQLRDYNYFKSKESIDSFILTKEFLEYPSVKLNLDSLKSILISKPADSIEGIYYYDKYFTVGVFKSGEKEFTGTVLNSESELWLPGQISIHLFEYAPNMYKAIYSHPRFKNFIMQSNEKYRDGALVNSYFYGTNSQGVYTKQLQQVDHVNLSNTSNRFELKNINDDVQYLLIRTFQADRTTMQESKRFFDSIQLSLKAPHLILDLRNNEGGAKKETKKYLSLLKKYVNHGQLYILLNNGTLSQSEIFTLKLKKLKNTTTFGQTTKGMLTYGSNYSKRERLPSGFFEIYPTDMKGKKNLLLYENFGIKPDIFLKNDSNWIIQVTDIINMKKNQ